MLKRFVIIEKSWQYHIGSCNYWNNKLKKIDVPIY